MHGVINEQLNINNRNNSAVEAIPALNTSYHLSDEASRAQKGDFVSNDTQSPEALFKVCLVAFQKAGVSPFTEADLLDRCILLPITDTNRMELIRIIDCIFTFNEDKPSYSCLKFKDRKPLENLRSIEEILRERRNRKIDLMNRSIARIEEMFRRNTPAMVLSIMRRLQLYLYFEKVAEEKDAFELFEHRRLAKPHVIKRRETSYICIFCSLNCHSITALQAHLISQKHHFLNLPEIWVDAIEKVRQYEVDQLASMGGDPRSSSKSATTTPSRVMDDNFLKMKNLNDYSQGVLEIDTPLGEIEMNTNNERLSSVSVISEVKTDIDDVSDDAEEDEEEEEAEEFDEDEIMGESFEAAEGSSEAVKLKPVIAHYMTCLFCGKSVSRLDNFDGHVCTIEVSSLYLCSLFFL